MVLWKSKVRREFTTMSRVRLLTKNWRTIVQQFCRWADGAVNWVFSHTWQLVQNPRSTTECCSDNFVPIAPTTQLRGATTEHINAQMVAFLLQLL